MYRGYKTYRGYLNAKLHGLSIVISGSSELLKYEVCEIIKARENTDSLDQSKPDLIELSVKLLTDKEAVTLYNKLINVANDIEKNSRKAKQILKLNDGMTDGQMKAIISICKYKLKWKPESTFKYLTKTIPEIKDRIKPGSTNLKLLFANIKKSEANTIIKRLDMMIKKNEKSNK